MPVIAIHIQMLYNNMMSRFLLAGLTLIGSVMLPLAAHAYMSPEEVLYEEGTSGRFVPPPPSKRETADRKAAQQEQSAQRRAREQAAAFGSGSSMQSSSQAAHEAAPEPTDVTDEPVTLTPEQMRDQRILDRIKEAQLRAAFGGDDETLHGGAPLSETGPATVLITLAIAGAIGETWRRVRKAENTFEN